MQLSKEQQKIVDAPEFKIVVMSCAASGKTRMMTERIRRALKLGGEPSKIVVITFTNLAASELIERLGDDYKEGMFVGTVHSYANFLLNAYGIDTKDLRDQEDFDALFTMVKENPECVKEVGFLCLDEAQDSNGPQYEFIFELVQPKTFFVVGDLRQLIYDFQNEANPDPADPKYMLALMRRKDVTVYDLTENYRNGYQIIGYSNWLVGKMKNIFPMDVVCKTGKQGEVIKNFPLASLMKEIKMSDDSYKDWFILCRTNGQVEMMNWLCEKNGIPFSNFKQGNLALQELRDEMNKDSVKILTIHSSKGLEAKNVAVYGHGYYGDSALRVTYVACTRAKERLYWIAKDKF